MKKITHKSLFEMLKSKLVLIISSSMVLTSCVIQTGGYTETDGVYYDPNKDTLPEGVVMSTGNRVGDYYDYQANDSQNKYLNSDNRNQNWKNSQSSDWGNFAGTETYYSNNWGYSPFGYYSGFGFGMSFGWGSPWGFGGYYNPWGFGYNPWYGHYNPWYGYYNPYYYGYSPYYYGYNPYHGYYNPYGYYYGSGYGYNNYQGGFNYKRSGSDGDGVSRNSMRNSNDSGFRNSNDSGYRNTNSSGFRTNSNNSGFRTDNSANDTRYNQTRIRNYQQDVPQQNSPRYEQPTRNYNDGGFRSGGDGGFRSGGDGGFRSSGGGFNSGSSSSGSTRSGGSGGFR